MSLQAPATSQSQKKFAPQAEFEVDNYPCRVSQVIDLGLHHKSEWDAVSNKFVKNLEKAPVHLLMVSYEFTTEFMKDEQGNELEDKPRWLSEQFALHAMDNDLATSTKRMTAFDPGFTRLKGDWAKVAGEPCAVTIAHKKNGKAKIGSVSKPMKGMVVAELKNPIKVFTLDAPDLQVFQSLPTWLQDNIKENLNFKGSKLEALLSGETPQDKPQEQQQAPAEEPDVSEDQDEDAPW